MTVYGVPLLIHHMNNPRAPGWLMKLEITCRQLFLTTTEANSWWLESSDALFVHMSMFARKGIVNTALSVLMIAEVGKT